MDEKLVNALMHFFLDPKRNSVYHEKWSTWLCVNDYIEVFLYSTYKSDEQMKNILSIAQKRAKGVENSKLTKALSED